MKCAGLDIGGTKIEARLFDRDMTLIETRRIPAPAACLSSFLNAVGEQINWILATAADGPGLPIGIALPGIVERATGASNSANLPISGVNVRAALAERFGREFVFCNDCDAFAYSEANDGAAPHTGIVIGLILGTGLGAGLCINGELAFREVGLAVEIGHIGMSGRTLAALDLPLWTCGCGRVGCAEAYVSGQGLERLSKRYLGVPVAAHALADHPDGDKVLDIWSALMAEVMDTLQLLLDPQAIILGGGLSKIPNVVARLEAATGRLSMAGVPMPAVSLALHGDSSGARGVALLARSQSSRGHDA